MTLTSSPTARSWRPGRSRIVAAGVAALAIAALVAPGAARARASTSSCPGAEPLVSKATWHSHRLAPGVRLREGKAPDSEGVVEMHVLQVDLTRTNLSFGPLMKHVAQRSPLSQLAGGKKHLVAATNTGYFDFQSGAPSAPVISYGSLLTATHAGQTVVGFTPKGRIQGGNVWLKGRVYVNGVDAHGVVGINTNNPQDGLTFYTSQWGPYPVPLRWNSVSRYIVDGVVKTGPGQQADLVHSTGTLLVANGYKAKNWLNKLKVGDSVKAKLWTGYNTAVPFAQAYGVGIQLVQKAGVVRNDLACRYPTTQPARTAIGFANAGRTMWIAVVTDHPHTNVHGLDQKQMSGLMVQLGATRAYGWDGSGSSELLARMPGTTSLSMRNYPADGKERPMPVGFGIYSR